MGNFKIILDAGHGKETPGKRIPDNSMHEFEFNAAVAQYAKELLSRYQGIDVQFTHDPTGQVDIPLKKRTDYANQWGANVFVSIHANAAGDLWKDGADGIETYTYITKPKEAMELAAVIQKRLVANTGRDNRGVKQADFHVLRESHMTAVLCECGFMTDHQEAELLKTNVYRQQCAAAIVDSLAEKYQLKLKPIPVPPAAVPKPAPAKEGAGYFVQVGYFKNKDNADALAKQLHDKGFAAITKGS